MPSTDVRDDGAAAPRATVPLTPTAVTTRTERRTAAGHWLLASAPSVRLARRQWQEKGVALLRPGALYAAVRVPAAVIHAAAQGDTPQACADRLSDTLDGPVFYDPTSFRHAGGYTVLLPASAARVWNVPSTVLHDPTHLLNVPAPERCEPANCGPWWVVPLDGPGQLASTTLLASFASLGRRRIVLADGELS